MKVKKSCPYLELKKLEILGCSGTIGWLFKNHYFGLLRNEKFVFFLGPYCFIVAVFQEVAVKKFLDQGLSGDALEQFRYEVRF